MFQRVVSVPLQALKWLAFGSVQFSEQEEYLEFRYKFLIVLMLTAAALTGLFILGLVSQINLIGWAHGRMMITFVTATLVLWLLLRGAPKRFKRIGWTYEVLSLCESASALIYVPENKRTSTLMPSRKWVIQPSSWGTRSIKNSFTT